MRYALIALAVAAILAAAAAVGALVVWLLMVLLGSGEPTIHRLLAALALIWLLTNVDFKMEAK